MIYRVGRVGARAGRGRLWAVTALALLMVCVGAAWWVLASRKAAEPPAPAGLSAASFPTGFHAHRADLRGEDPKTGARLVVCQGGSDRWNRAPMGPGSNPSISC